MNRTDHAYELLLLDYDGTLCDSKPAIVYAIEQTFESFGHPAPAPETVSHLLAMGIPIQDSFQILSRTTDISDRDLWINRYREIYRSDGDNHALLYPGVKETLETLAQQNIPLVVLSNKSIGAVKHSLEKFGIDPLLSLIIGDGIVNDPAYKLKPHATVFHEFVRPHFHGIAPERILMTGDTQTDIDFGHNCGIRSCWASYGYGNPDLTRAANPHHTIEHFSELKAIAATAA